MKIILATVATLVFSISGFAQKNCQPMPGVNLANPRCDQAPKNESTQAANAIEWTFPKPDQVTVTKEGRTYYVLTNDVFAEKTRIGDESQVEAALVYFTPKILGTFEVMRLAGELKDVDRMLAFSAIGLSVKTRGLPQFIAKGQLFEKEFFFFKIWSGRVVAAHVSDDRKFVIVLPAPPSVTY